MWAKPLFMHDVYIIVVQKAHLAFIGMKSGLLLAWGPHYFVPCIFKYGLPDGRRRVFFIGRG